ncbi:MAG: recombination protein RecR [Caldimicrobium sp.]|jgi:recombination protein RecR|nr:recombination protein RecR [Caldimicrobium sp.]
MLTASKNIYPRVLKSLIEKLAKLPGLGERSSTRIVFYLLSKPELCEELSFLISELPKKVKLCKKCRNLSEDELCSICLDNSRNRRLLCIVESPVTLYAIESLSLFNGTYFVLHYLLSPREGITAHDLPLEELKGLIEENEVEEVILALSPTLSGNATAEFLKEFLSPFKLKLSRLALGIPYGLEIQFVDPLTLRKSLTDREVLKNG